MQPCLHGVLIILGIPGLAYKLVHVNYDNNKQIFHNNYTNDSRGSILHSRLELPLMNKLL